MKQVEKHTRAPHGAEKMRSAERMRSAETRDDALQLGDALVAAPLAAVPARATALIDAPRPWWRHGGWICAAVGLATHVGLLAYAKGAPSPVYTFAAVQSTDIDIETDPDEPKDETTTTAEIPKPVDDPNASNTGEEEQGAAVANNRPKGAVGSNFGPSPVIASDDPSASDAAGTAPNAIRREWDPSSDDAAYGDPDSPDSREFDPNKPTIAGNLPGFDPSSIGPGKKAKTTTDPTEKVAVGKANDVLQEELRKKDNKLGLILPAAGTVASTVKSAVWGSGVPEKSQGTIVVTLGADGSVTGVKVAGMAGGTAGDWEGIAANVKAALSAKTLVLTEEYKKGAIITINVKSKMQNPSGTDPDNPVSFGTTTTFDISDIGAKPIRQVTTQTNVVAVK